MATLRKPIVASKSIKINKQGMLNLVLRSERATRTDLISKVMNFKRKVSYGGGQVLVLIVLDPKWPAQLIWTDMAS